MNTPIPVSTFTCIYDAKEDRLLLTLNYQEPMKRVDFWITRSFLLKLLPVFFDLKAQTSAPIQSSQRGASPTDTSTYQLTRTHPILLESVDFQRHSDHTVIIFKSLSQEIHAAATLEPAVLERFVSLVVAAAPRFEWGLYDI